MGSTQPNPIHVGWVGLGCVGFFLTHHGGLGQKIPSIRPMHTRVRKSQRERGCGPCRLTFFTLLLQVL